MKHRIFGRMLIVLIFAAIVLGFFLADTVIRYFQGGESAPAPLLVLLSVLFLGSGIAVIGVLIWREWKRLKQEREYFDHK